MVRQKRKENKTLEQIVKAAQEKYGEKALAVAGDVEEEFVVKHLPSGIPELDSILGGGFPRGHISELFGPESAGKSLICLKTIAETQRTGGVAAYVDTEGEFAPEFAKINGVDLDTLLISNPDNGEDALEIVRSLVKKKLDIIVLDSITSLFPKNMIASAVETQGYAPGVKLWNAGIARIKPLVTRSTTAFVVTNQVRENVGVMYGPTTTEPMGRMSRHNMAIRLEVRRKEWIKKNDVKVGQVVLMRIAKTKVDGVMPYAECVVDVPYITKKKEETDVAIQKGK
jgi:recombination protein RecA